MKNTILLNVIINQAAFKKNADRLFGLLMVIKSLLHISASENANGSISLRLNISLMKYQVLLQ